MEEVTLNRQTLEDLHTRAKNPKYGATCGRVAGRIAGARFSIDGTEYELEANNGPNTLHGGTKGYHNCEWEAHIIRDQEFQFNKPDGEMVILYGFHGVNFRRTSTVEEQKFPGEILVEAIYMVNKENKMFMSWIARPKENCEDFSTPINMTNHAYWNLSGDFKDSTVANRTLQLNCPQYLPMGPGSIPTGEIASVTNTPLDFTS